jgi:hypothetical protein
VRALSFEQPALLSELSASGSLPIEVAHSSGYVQIVVALLRRSAPGSESITDYGTLLERYVGHLSHACACAGWLSNIEFLIWCLVVGDEFPIEDTFGFRQLSREELADLQFLSEGSQHWPHWDEREQRVCLIPLTRWQHLYREWYERQSQSGAA